MFRTEIPFIPQPQQLPLSARVLTVGSCFAETIGSRLVDYKVDALVNPFGTVFNPLAACQLLRAAAGEEVDWQQHLVEARGRWQSYDLHATTGAESPVGLLQRIQELVSSTGEFLRTADAVVLTLGTAWVYRLLETGELVNNCHKVPAEKFAKELLTPDEIVNAVAETHAYLRRSQPNLRFILTVSPVRHLKDTLILNSVSKSALRVACHYLSELLPDVSYFPAYELLLDDLRDYRFYAEDMLHPSKVAEDYIWERFTRTYFNADFGRFKQEWMALRQALAHRPLYAAAPEHRQFLEGILARLQQVGAQTDVQTEMADVQHRLATLPVPAVIEPLPEPDDEERIDIGDEAAPVVEALLAEAAVESPAVSADEAVADDPSEEKATEILPEDDMARPAPKKKRRSRGGAKRTARKRAALAAQEMDEPEGAPTTPVAAELPGAGPTVAPETVATPSTTTAPLLPPAALPNGSTTRPETTPAEPAEATELLSSTLDKSRRGRSAGQILADQKKRRGGRKSGAAAPAATADVPIAAAAPVAAETSSRESTVKPATTQAAPPAPALPAPEPTPIVPAPVPVNEVAPAPVEPASKPTEPTEPSVKPAVADTPVPVAAKPKRARPVRKKPLTKTAADQEAPAAAVETPETPLAAVPATSEPTVPTSRPARKKPTTKAAPRKPVTTAPEVPAPAGKATAKAPPKRRPTRKKPAPTDETPSAS